MKIVGTVDTKEEAEQIETIYKLFIFENRIRHLASTTRTQKTPLPLIHEPKPYIPLLKTERP